MSAKKGAQLVLTYENIDITEKDLKCLKPSTFVNDNIINFYLKYMYRCLLNDHQRQKVHVFDSFFCEALDQMDEARVQRWLRRVNIFEKEILMIPAMIDEHWFLIVVRDPCAILANINNDNSTSAASYRSQRMRPAIIIMDSMPSHVVDKKPQLIQYVYNFIRIACSIKAKTIFFHNLRRFMPSRESDVEVQVKITKMMCQHQILYITFAFVLFSQIIMIAVFVCWKMLKNFSSIHLVFHKK